MSASCLFAANHLSRTYIHNAVQIQKIYFALQAVTRNTILPRNYDPVHLLFHVVYPTPSEGWGHRSDSSCFDIYSFLRLLIIRAGHLRWKLAILVTTFGKILITITDVLITISGIFVMYIVRSGGDQEFR